MEALLLKDIAREITGLRYMIDELEILTSAGRNYLLSQPMLMEGDAIEQKLLHQESFLEAYLQEKHGQLFSHLSTKLMQLLDISGTVRHLEHHNVLSDVELFEIKSFALLSEDIRSTIDPLGISFLKIPSLLPVIDLLDPEKKRIPHFYIYDQYSTTLSILRAQVTLMINNNCDEVEIDEIRFRAQRVEDEVRKDLSLKLEVYVGDLMNAVEALAYLDVLHARTLQIVSMGLHRPIVTHQHTEYKGLFAPQVREQLRKQRKKFQPVDISFSQGPTLIMGANMAGKSVLLHSVALAQALFQFGCFVPAQEAQIVPVEKIALSIGDAEDMQRGLSSYAAEMLRVNAIVEDAIKGIRQLVLIDELARTTNPQEGNAIVCSVLDLLCEHKVSALLTSHYAIEKPCRKLRVKGFRQGKQESSLEITIDNINSFIDYSLEEVTDNKVPHEAVRIAEIIGVSPLLIKRIRQHLV